MLKSILLSLALAITLGSAPAHAVVDGDCDFTQGTNSTQQLANGCAEEIGAILTTLSGLPSIYATLSHGHTMAQITGLVAALAALQPLDTTLTLLSADPADNQVFVGTGANTGTWVVVPDSEAAGVILGFDQTTGVFSTKADDDVPDAGEVDDTALAAQAVDGGTGGEIADDSITAADIAPGAVGASEAASLDAGDVTTGTFADALINGANEADEVNPTLGSQTQGNYVAGLTNGFGITVTGTAGEGWSPTVAVTLSGTLTDENCITYEATGPALEIQSCAAGGGLASTDIDTSAELRAILTDETGTGALLFGGAAGSLLGYTPSGSIAATDVAGAIAELDSEKQPDLQFQDENGNIGTSGGITSVDCAGAGITCSESAGEVTVTVPGGGGGAPLVITGVPSADQADFNPASWSSSVGTIKLQPTAPSFIGGLSFTANDHNVTLVNDSAFPMWLIGEDASSTAANRFDLRGDRSFILLPGETISFRYSSTQSRWRQAGTSRDIKVVSQFGMYTFPGTGTTIISDGVAAATTSTTSHVGAQPSPTDDFLARAIMQNTFGTANSGAGTYAATLPFYIGNTAGFQGFAHTGRIRFQTVGATGGLMAGMSAAGNNITTQPSVQTNCFLLGLNGGQTNLRIFYGGSTAQTPIDLGANFPAPSITAHYEYLFYAAPQATTIYYMVRRIDTRFLASGSITGTPGVQIPAATTPLGHRMGVMVGATASANTILGSYLITVVP